MWGNEIHDLYLVTCALRCYFVRCVQGQRRSDMRARITTSSVHWCHLRSRDNVQPNALNFVHSCRTSSCTGSANGYTIIKELQTSVQFFILSSFLLQESTSSKSSSVYSFSTTKPRQLPVTDVKMWLGRDSNEAIGVELGPVCFSH